jgi:hypothetical protein
LLGALQVAAEQCVVWVGGQALGQALRLGQTEGVQGHIQLALKALLPVPVGFAVADE